MEQDPTAMKLNTQLPSDDLPFALFWFVFLRWPVKFPCPALFASTLPGQATSTIVVAPCVWRPALMIQQCSNASCGDDRCYGLQAATNQRPADCDICIFSLN
eukprot:5757817-Pleurochrysis_carterae.AAC.7